MAGILNYLLIWVAPFAVMITTIIVIHELGHFLVARACGVVTTRTVVFRTFLPWIRRFTSVSL